MTPDPQPPAPGDDMPDESTDAPTEPLDTDERAELERLRAEVASLRAHTHSASTATPREPRRIGRRIVAGVLVVLCAFLTILGVVTRYIQNDIIDTDRYVATVTPLASDPAVQEQVITSVTAAIDQQLNLQTVVADALQKITELTPADRPRIDAAFVGLAPVLAGQATSYINSTVTDFVRSPDFQALWVDANRRAQTRLLGLVSADPKHAAVTMDQAGTISIQLGPIIDRVKQRLVDRGFSLAARIPTINKEFVIIQSPELARAQNIFHALDRAGTWLPWLALACAIGAVAVVGAGRRRGMVTIIAVALLGAMFLLAIALAFARSFYLHSIPTDVLSPASAAVIFDTLINPLRIPLRVVAVIALAVAVISFFSGPSRTASATRDAFRHAAMMGGRGRRAPNAVEQTLWRIRIPVRATIAVVAGLVLVFWEFPTGMVVLWTAVTAVLILVAFEFAAAPGRNAKTVAS
ncbi:hypothetical protein K8O93_24015 [Gordonia bronchialis]|uniref:hypothetical protein n=1 Tax=Gordonia bronchialis TaxID=2054 RepID=UPI001CBC3094|nr:hypothetical protein [Gordonia bronchialis]UAK38052.1 hypothetical protein K8O93_24015 [Gordonia bronchialis]